jgi:type IV pilus biogenesis protein PilP
MSRLVDSLGLPGLLAPLALVVGWPSIADAQTIGDYSRAQRALLEATMSQATARFAGLGASTPTPAASAASAAPVTQRRAVETPHYPVVRISGVFASSSRSLAEVAVDGAPYLLTAGEAVPGTAWLVETVATDRVVLSRRDGGRGGVEKPHKTYALPALR